MITLLKSKISEIKITGSNHDYEGSITLDPEIMENANIHESEQVAINSKYGKGRIITYVIAGKRSSGCCELNGGACNHFLVGEIVHILTYQQLSDTEAKNYKPIII